MDRWAVVFDIGKTLAKLSLWNAGGELIAQRSRPNQPVATEHYVGLDTGGIESWLTETLAHFTRLGPIGTIIPVGHGAALAILKNGRLACPPMDYETPVSTAVRDAYDAGRDPFALTGSPRLPLGLNLGVQLHMLESIRPEILDGDATILPWAQYWAWVLSGVAASEVSSLGCHTDLWWPTENRPSAMAARRGWAQRMAPLRRADEILGTIRPEWVSGTGLPTDVGVFCGLHDSNAALLGARGLAEINGREATVLSTGTWFVAMRTVGGGSGPDIEALPETRDCLMNVDPFGNLVPSSRFMGGREIELLLAGDLLPEGGGDQDRVIALNQVLEADAMVLPTMVPGSGPFPSAAGGWERRPANAEHSSTAIGLYAALIADASLDLIGARERIIVQGRFARYQSFVDALATLRPNDRIYVSTAHDPLSLGALGLLNPGSRPSPPLAKVDPLLVDLASYRSAWLRRIESVGCAS